MPSPPVGRQLLLRLGTGDGKASCPIGSPEALPGPSSPGPSDREQKSGVSDGKILDQLREISPYPLGFGGFQAPCLFVSAVSCGVLASFADNHCF